MSYDLTGRALRPLTDLITHAEFPLAEYLPAELFADLYYTDSQASQQHDGLHLALRLAVEGELALGPPGVPGLALVVGAGGTGWTSLPVELVVGPEPRATLEEVPLTLRVDRTLLRPMRSPTEVDEHAPGVDISSGRWRCTWTSRGSPSTPTCLRRCRCA